MPSIDSSQPILRLWNFNDAPLDLLRLAPASYPGGWIAQILPCEEHGLLEVLVSGGSGPDGPVLAVHVESVGTIVVGPSLAGAASPDDPD